MAIRQRGSRWMVETYNPSTKKKGYVGTYLTYEEAVAVEAAVRAGRPVPKRDPLSDFRIGHEPVVYFISAVDLGLVKIGWTNSLVTRFSDLATACPVELRLLHVERGAQPERERELHRQFRIYRVRGEWFRIAGGLAEFLDATFDRLELRLVDGREAT